MRTIDEILQVAVEIGDEKAKDLPAVLLSRDEDAGPTIAALEEYFGADDDRQEVHLIIQGREAGRLTRSRSFALVRPVSKGLGGSDAGTLPGPGAYRFQKLRCPIDGQEFLAVRFDPNHPPTCISHQGTPLEKTK